MKKLFFFGALLSMLCLGACGGGAKSAAVADADTLVEKDTTPLPDTMYASVEKLQWRVEVLDSTVDGTLHVLDDPYWNQTQNSHSEPTIFATPTLAER